MEARFLPPSTLQLWEAQALWLREFKEQQDIWEEGPRPPAEQPPRTGLEIWILPSGRKQKASRSFTGVRLTGRGDTWQGCRIALDVVVSAPRSLHLQVLRLSVYQRREQNAPGGVSILNIPRTCWGQHPCPQDTWGSAWAPCSPWGPPLQASFRLVCTCRSHLPAPPPPYPQRLERQILKLLAQRELLKRSQINMHVKLISCISWHQNKYLGNRTPSGHWEHMLELELID